MGASCGFAGKAKRKAAEVEEGQGAKRAKLAADDDEEEVIILDDD